MIVDRNGFKEQAQKYLPRVELSPGSPIWNPEKDMDSVCEWFVCVRPIDFHLRYRPDGRGDAKGMFWSWCNETLSGEVRCFLSNDNRGIEWWGFTRKDDVAIWLLKWSR
jgi:hypothetical protein